LRYLTSPEAVFDEDIVRHYVAFLDHRRELRPIEEYREATSEELAEFDEHFDKRKVELGSCGRPYGTPCQHEHACLTEMILKRPIVVLSTVCDTASPRKSGSVRGSGVSWFSRSRPRVRVMHKVPQQKSKFWRDGDGYAFRPDTNA
jgi:hypothetical protein